MPCPTLQPNLRPTVRRARSGKVQLLLLLCVLVGLGVMASTLILGPKPGGPHPWVGKPIPAATLQPLLNTDTPFDTASLQGKTTLINFWGPWCPPCLMEFPELLKLRENFANEPGFQFVSIASDGGWGPSGVGYQENEEYLKDESKMILAKYNSDLPIYVDLDGEFRQKLIQTAEFTGYPTTILVGPDGKTAAVWLGYSPSLGKEASKIIREQLTSAQSAAAGG
ncbi:TlpA family protein disulfide reductase [Bremerella cremea]|uniref:TlpA family protein disulfide reductase n=1 Tax=Bremerella cremea TaxID=1031537 RepID=A0A368KP93_9BACT|nr:TlpA disulfide reductase family protein [Bremerella cremea]RCS41340.1 TlpA family protein disulfide reductase [Bremerella cremea]